MNFDPFTTFNCNSTNEDKAFKVIFGIAYCNTRPRLFMLRSRLDGHIVRVHPRQVKNGTKN